MAADRSRRVAIIGGGMSGITTYWALQGSRHHVHLFEAGDNIERRLARPASFNAKEALSDAESSLAIFHPDASPNFNAFLESISVEVSRGRGFSFSCLGDGDFEDVSWGAFPGIRSFFGNLFDFEMWELRLEVLRFTYFALDHLRDPDVEEKDSLFSMDSDGTDHPQSKQPADQLSLGQFLIKNNYSERFIATHLVPLISILWNLGDRDSVLELPAHAVFRFFWDNNLLKTQPLWPLWAVFKKGHDFQRALKKSLSGKNIHYNTSVDSLAIDAKTGEFLLRLENGLSPPFNHLVFAVPAAEALRILDGEATFDEMLVLKGFTKPKVVATMHSDPSFMPQSRRDWALINYMPKPPSDGARSCQPSVTYWVDLLRGDTATKSENVFITINAAESPDPCRVQKIWEECRPAITKQALICQTQFNDMQNVRGISFCGAWTGYGTYEDSVRSAFEVAVDHLGADLPFERVKAYDTHRDVPRARFIERKLRALIKIAPLLLLFLQGMMVVLSYICLPLKRRRKVHLP